MTCFLKTCGEDPLKLKLLTNARNEIVNEYIMLLLGDIVARKTVVWGLIARVERENVHKAKPSEMSRRKSAIYPNHSFLCYHIMLML